MQMIEIITEILPNKILQELSPKKVNEMRLKFRENASETLDI